MFSLQHKLLKQAYDINMKKIIIALVGNPNSGKTTIFNEITALNQHVGNLPGVTVEIVSGKIIGNPDCNAVDLPGLYSLNTLSREESITKEFLLNEKPNVLINVVDCTKLKRNLFLTLQLKELNIPTVIALNMIDKYEKNNEKLNIKELEKRMEDRWDSVKTLESCLRREEELGLTEQAELTQKFIDMEKARWAMLHRVISYLKDEEGPEGI